MRKYLAFPLLMAIGATLTNCSSHAGAIPSTQELSSCSAPAPAAHAQLSGYRKKASSAYGSLPGDVNDDPDLYSTSATAAENALGDSINTYDASGSPTTTPGGTGGRMLNSGCASGGRATKSYVPSNCLAWYVSHDPNHVHDPNKDEHIATTCQSMWIPDDFTPTFGFKGTGVIHGFCSAENMDDGNDGCTLAYVARSCGGSKNIDQAATDDTNAGHNNRISGVFSVSMQMGNVNQPLGWEYQTYGGQEFLQLSNVISVNAGVVSMSIGQGPVVPFSGNLYSMIQAAAKSIHIAASLLPYPYNQITPSTQIRKMSC